MRPPLSDRCPKCAGLAFMRPLRSVLTDGGDGVRCDYACTACGNQWFTAWNTAGLYPEWRPTVEALCF